MARSKVAPRPAAVVIGTGRVGTALAGWLADVCLAPVLRVSRGMAATAGRRAALPHGTVRSWDELLGELAGSPDQPPPLIFLAVPDDAIPQVAADLAGCRRSWKGTVVLHLSGAGTSAWLAPLSRRGAAAGSLHPMMTFPGRGTVPPSPAGLVFSFEGSARARRVALGLVRAWGGLPLTLTPGQKLAYHLAATLVGPGLVVQMAAAEDLLRRSGMAASEIARARSGLMQLAVATAGNLHYGTPAAFTGPWARGDQGTMAAHRKCLASLHSPEALRRVYDDLAALGAAVAKTTKRVGQTPQPKPEKSTRKTRATGRAR